MQKAIRHGIDVELKARRTARELVAQSEELYDVNETMRLLEEEMLTAANNHEFEKAAEIRDKIQALKKKEESTGGGAARGAAEVAAEGDLTAAISTSMSNRIAGTSTAGERPTMTPQQKSLAAAPSGTAATDLLHMMRSIDLKYHSGSLSAFFGFWARRLPRLGRLWGPCPPSASVAASSASPIVGSSSARGRACGLGHLLFHRIQLIAKSRRLFVPLRLHGFLELLARAARGDRAAIESANLFQHFQRTRASWLCRKQLLRSSLGIRCAIRLMPPQIGNGRLDVPLAKCLARLRPRVHHDDVRPILLQARPVVVGLAVAGAQIQHIDVVLRVANHRFVLLKNEHGKVAVIEHRRLFPQRS